MTMKPTPCQAAALFLGLVFSHAGGPQQCAAQSTQDRQAGSVQLVTGPAGNINAALAGGATLQVYVTPAPEGGTSSNYPPGTSIVGQELRAPGGTAFTAMFNVKFKDWDPDGNQVPLLETWQVKILPTDFEGASANPPEPGCDLTFPAVACPEDGPAGEAFCADALEQGSRCISGMCEPVFFDRTRDDWAFLSLEPNVFTGVDRSPGSGLRLGVTSSPFQVIDSHLLYYGATLTLHVPACANGTYTISIVPGSETFFLDEGPGSGNIIPILAYHSAQLTFPGMGSCCYGLGTASAGCTDGVTELECGDDEPLPFFWSLSDCTMACVLGSCCHGIGTQTAGCMENVTEPMCDSQPPPIVWNSGGTCASDCVLGACCYGIGTPAAGCTDGELDEDCGDDEPGPFVFTPDGSCSVDCSGSESANAFTYQGSLEKNGVQVNGLIDLQAALWDDESAGSQIGYVDEAVGLEVVNGIFTTTLDFGPLAVFDGSPRWIEISVRQPAGSGNYTLLSPRFRVYPGPEAQHAERATAAHALDAPDGNPIDAVFVDNEGRVGIGTTLPTHPLELASGAHVTAGGIWTNASATDLKENFASVNSRDVLAHLLKLPIQVWNYKVENQTVRHMGPMAEDFHRRFGLGGTDTHIGTLDADGVALAAIQGLHEIVQEKNGAILELKISSDHRIEQLNAEISRLKSELLELRALLNTTARKEAVRNDRD